jgi:predicted ester cyclase
MSGVADCAGAEAAERRNRHAALARRFREDLWNSGDLSIADEIIAADCIWHARVPLTTDFVRGPDAVRQLVLFYHLAFSDIRMTVDELIVDGDTLAARWTGRGRHRGDLLVPPGGASAAPAAKGVAAEGETVTVGIDYLRIGGGRIAEAWVAWDILSLIEPFLPAESGGAPTGGPLTEFLPILKRLR